MRADAFFYRLAYRFGKPRWDSDDPEPGLKEIARSLRPGRALDLGCGTGANSMYLAAQGWQVVGVDFAPGAIHAATANAAAQSSSARFVLGDVSQLSKAGIDGEFDLVIDIGCYHGLSESQRGAYARGVSGVARSGADFYLAGISNPPLSWRLLGAHGVTGDELRARFGWSFELLEERAVATIGHRSGLVLYHLVRRPPVVESKKDNL